jgi:hypothetical protein
MSRRAWAPLAAVLLLLGLLAGCGGTSATPAPQPSSPAPTRAAAVREPAAGECHQLTWDQAVSSAVPGTTVSCATGHTSQTYAVGRLRTVVDGHLLATSSPQVQAQVSAACPGALAHWLGATPEQLRLTTLRPVWFTPTPQQEALGARWYRCDVVAVSGSDALATMTGSLAGVLGGKQAGDWAMCGTARPGTTGFERVPCSESHTWKALSVVDLTPGRDGAYPGVAAAKDAGAGPCKEAGRNVAKDALDYQWGYDWPSQQQWAAGQTYGVCWAPS